MQKSFINTSHTNPLPGRRNEVRIPWKLFIRIKPLNKQHSKNIDAVLVDISDGGIGLLTHASFDIGTRIAIEIGGSIAAIAEVVHTGQDQFEAQPLVRLGAKLINKTGHWVF